ncbi:retropepsin-like aspartic protease family protein [Ketobacter alkanivorans]|uniref:Peptidase A2 domain-containing protein n=1 Tax=Ketobacter alkanivorans TaxID=1917421 RepID=A0A2K9LLD5_9GAMM|nr:retropepsin-like aspartic protease [Ketobacter alkanivorans]AUM12991.1 hypothetical protein Kalk_11395 [Ketobacter alkanivorans]
MTKTTPWLLCLLVGFALGWWSAVQWVSPVATATSPLSGQSPEPASKPADTPVDLGGNAVSRWLQLDQPEALIAYLDTPALSLPGRQQALQQLDDTLLQWQDEQQWGRLLLWLEPLHTWDRNRELWQDWLASAHEGLGQRRDALLILFESHATTLSAPRRQYLMDSIEQLLADQLARQRTLTPTRLSQNFELMPLLLLALEKQPQYAPFGIMLSDVYEASGEWEQALFQLQLLPYSDTHQPAIDERKERLEEQLAAQQRAQEGIGLQHRMGQFVVTVVFDERVELNLMIDTGATITALNARAIALLQQYTDLHTTDQQVQVNTANGMVVSPLYEIGSMRIGGWEQLDVQLLQVNLPSEHVDGLLGMNFLSRYAFSIDQDQALLFLDSK